MISVPKKYLLNVGGTIKELSFPCVMGIINLTPDSYHAASRTGNVNEAVLRCRQMISEGAAIIDVGAVSTRAGSDYPGVDEELKRLKAIFPALRKEFPDHLFSIDTSNAAVAEQMLDSGADIINDISAGEHDKKMLDLIALHKVPYIMMHMRGWPKNMQQQTRYDNILLEMQDYFMQKIQQLNDRGVSDLFVDPGFGFSKTLEQNYYVFNHLERFTFFDKPLVVGISRKSMIYKALESSPDEVLAGTIALQTLALMKGASVLRVHDVAAAMQCIQVLDRLKNSEQAH